MERCRRLIDNRQATWTTPGVSRYESRTMRTANLFADTTPPTEGERFETLLQHRNLVVERILSSAAITPSEYVQTQDEWVLLASGEAEMLVDGQPVTLAAGDHLFLPAGTPHTVKRVSEGAVWLAVHLHPEAGAAT
jgi:cupin 2 domain-containing protein